MQNRFYIQNYLEPDGLIIDNSLSSEDPGFQMFQDEFYNDKLWLVEDTVGISRYVEDDSKPPTQDESKIYIEEFLGIKFKFHRDLLVTLPLAWKALRYYEFALNAIIFGSRYLDESNIINWLNELSSNTIIFDNGILGKGNNSKEWPIYKNLLATACEIKAGCGIGPLKALLEAQDSIIRNSKLDHEI
jgi:hypothetical protein